MSKVPSNTSQNDLRAQQPHEQCVRGELKRHPIGKELRIGGHRKHKSKIEILKISISKESIETETDSAVGFDRRDNSNSDGLWFRFCELFSKIAKRLKKH